MPQRIGRSNLQPSAAPCNPQKDTQHDTRPYAKQYAHLLTRFALSDGEEEGEVFLAEAFELGRAMMDQQLPPDAVTMIHHEALLNFADTHPALVSPVVAHRLTHPLIEMTMAYGMAFREQMEKQYQNILNTRLEESRKLEAVGTLAAGIAHDFNNLLGSIIGFAEMAGDYLGEDTPGKRDIQQVLKASFRARDLVARLLAFARQSPLHPTPMDLLTEVKETLDLLRATLPPGVQTSLESDMEQATILADPSQIQQIVMNLCINAADALNDNGCVDIRIFAVPENDVLDAIPVRKVCLMVADHGTGMSHATLESVFNPFFTTKAPGKGSGLGLSVVYGIVQSLGGAIQVESRTRGDNRGTVFKVYLPRINNP
ncbi:sensor histidine kinase [Candidatus Symbiobacter mobilis]|uniref:histidine kinase n=1 Tax=Candidatus Symbiobacter mobilis CR TaxID=946483 RepID=U5N6Y4_9BURK|nr:ATP-binding protein [Candidatus Symbiobacter mobilis]AGX87296.1 signal transduction histidine kinase [Candidatus Symbiobacter mobilis CR]